MGYMIEHDSRVMGPYTLDELKERVEQNLFVLSDLVCDQFAGQWMPLSRLIRPRPAPPSGPLGSLLGRVSKVLRGDDGS